MMIMQQKGTDGIASPDSPGSGIRHELVTKEIQKILGLLLIPFFLVLIAILATLNVTTVYEPPFLLLLMNTLFIGIISIVIASITSRVYTKSGSVSVFLIGSGLLIFGLGSIVTGWFLPITGGQNIAVTIYNTCACIGSIFILVGAVISTQRQMLWRGVSSTWKVTAAYSGILVFVVLFSLAAMQGLVPLFFIQGVGPTVLRQVILENTVVFFAIASVLVMFTYLKGRSDFFFWYSISLALISIGLLAVLIPLSVGNLPSWGGRSAQYLGFVFALYAILIARRAAIAKGLPFEEVLAHFFADAEQSYKMLVDTATDAIVTFDDNDRILLWNSAAERMFGYTRDEAMGSSFPELAIDDRYIAVIKNEDEDIPVEGQHTHVPKSVEISGKRKDKTLFPVELTISRRRQEGRLIRTCILRDLTERKLAEEARIASEIRYRRLFEAAQDGILILNAETGQIVDANPFLIDMLGFSHEQFLGKKIWEIGLFKDLVANKDNFEELQRKEYIRYEDLPLETADGRHIAVEFVSNVYVVTHARVIQCNIRDITERKKIEVALNATETRYRRLFETAQDGILILDADTGQIVEVNPFLIAFLGFSREQFLGKKIWEIGLFKDIVANKDNFEELQRKESIRYENLPLETADGRNIAVEFVSNVYMVNNKKVIQCNIRDITDRKKLTEQIEASLAEKETLLKEIHHRVKNNLQIIISILNLQIRKIDDPTIIEALKDSQSRVRSMALVHEHLYKGKDFSHIDLGNYIRALGMGLSQSYEAAKQGIRFDFNIRDIYVEISTSLPLGLICNELITNSLKYAFKEKKDGKISITATEDPQALTFIVADNGVGMPEGITLENQTSLGLRLVSLLTGQINGTVVIDRTEGTKFVFTIPKPAEQKPTEDAKK